MLSKLASGGSDELQDVGAVKCYTLFSHTVPALCTIESLSGLVLAHQSNSVR